MRFRAVWVLASTKDPRAYETIVRLSSDPEERVNYDATVAIGIHKDPRSVEFLIGLISKLEDTTPVGLAMQHYGSSIVPALTLLIVSENIKERWMGMSLIGNFAQELNQPGLLEIIRPCLTDPHEEIREECEYWFKEVLPAEMGY